MKQYTDIEWKKLNENVNFNQLYKKKCKLSAQLDRRAKTILKTEKNENNNY
jgi:hypothetical protein